MGVIGNIGDTINDVSKKITKTEIKKYYSTYIKQSGEELTAAAKQTLINGVDSSSLIKKADIESLINKSPQAIEGNADYINQTGKLIKSLQAKDMEQFKEIASDLADSKRFNDSRYLDLLVDADSQTEMFRGMYAKASNENIKTLYKQSVKNKIPKKYDKYISEKQKDKVANVAYHANAGMKYFATNDPTTNQARIGVAAGAYMGVMTTARLAHGGGLTKNEYGERDIVGIPFV